MCCHSWRYEPSGDGPCINQIVAALPDSLVDLCTGVDLSKVRFLCFDEADRMLDMGFIDAVRSISLACSLVDKLVCMFSATWCVTRVRGY